MVEMLQSRTQTTSLHKVWAHAKIEGNKKADEPAKFGRELHHRIAKYPHEFAHASTPYYFQKDDWLSMASNLDKGPIRFLNKYLKKLDLSNNLDSIVTTLI